VNDILTLKAMNALVKGTLRPDLTAIRNDCPVAIVSLLKRAWSSDIQQRPTMSNIVDELINIASNVDTGTGIELPGQVD